MRRVALISYDWDFEVMSNYYDGMASCLQEHDDIQLVIFNAFGRYESFELDESAFEVFSLCDLDSYEGFLVQGNRMWPPALRQALVDKIVALGKPIVSISYGLDGACCVGTDNYQAMYQLVTRVLDDRDCKCPAFVNGFAGSGEAKARAQAYRDACAQRGIANPRFYQANWEMETGVKAAREMLAAQDDLPDVVFCCNDDLAVGVQETFQAAGVRVPEDVLVSGFDNRENSRRATPRISTVDRDYFGIGKTSMEVLVGLMAGAEPRQFVASPVRLVLSASCAYEDKDGFDASIAESLYSMDHALKNFYDTLVRFQPAVLAADNISEIMHLSESYFYEVESSNAWVTVCEGLLGDRTAFEATSYDETSLLMACCGSDRSRLAHDESHVYAHLSSRSLLPSECPMTQQVYMVYPLRHGSTCIGTLVTEGIPRVLKYGFLSILLTLLASAIESVRKKEMLQQMNARLDELYVHDQLTGLYNRFGLDRFGAIAYSHLLRDFAGAQFIFVDIDNMKRINDTCGHEMGDQALRDAAAVITRATTDENAFAMRYGGDEFLLICRRDLKSRIVDELRTLKSRVERPYDLRLSIGVYPVGVADQLSLMQAIEHADAVMYQIKKERKERERAELSA